MILECFWNEISACFEADDNNPVLADVAEEMKRAVKQGKTIWVFDTGHFVRWELFSKTGSFACVKKIDFTLTLSTYENELVPLSPGEGYTHYILSGAGVKEGDILVVGSVSGTSMNIADMAVEAKKMGLVTVALTSLKYSSAITAVHPCGKKLYEICDFVIDNGAPVGDAMVETSSGGPKICPASGLSAVYILWKIISLLTEKLLNEGLCPVLTKDFEGEYLKKVSPAAVNINDEYSKKIKAFFKMLRETQTENIKKAVLIIADAVCAGKRVHLSDIDEIIDSEFCNRAGGPVLFRQFRFQLRVTNEAFGKSDKLSGENTSLEILTDYIFAKSAARKDDVFILGSPCADNEKAAALGESAKKYGLSLITVTSGEGRLTGISDCVISTSFEKDSLISVPGTGDILPVSGLAGVFLMWSLVAVLAEEMIKRGKPLGIYKSINFPGGWDYHHKVCELYEQDGIGFHPLP